MTANPQSKVYGVNDPTLTYGSSGFINATVDGVVINDSAATVLSGALARNNYGVLTGEQVGSYAITQGTLAANSNYTIGYTGANLSITPASLTVTANPQSKVYGVNDPTLTYGSSGFINATVDGVVINDSAATVLSGALARNNYGVLTGEQVGSYAITQGTLAANSNYTIGYTGANLSITPASLTVTANPQSKVYGVNDPTLTYGSSGFINATVDGVVINDSAATVLSGALARNNYGVLTGEQVGSYAITQGTLAANSNYTIGYTGANLSITPASLTVTANPQSKVYGVNDPTLTYGSSGFINATVDGVVINDSAATVLSGALARNNYGVLTGEQVGSYAITQGTLAANSNYTIGYTGANLSITPASLTVTANPQSKVYGVNDPTLPTAAAASSTPRSMGW